MKVELIVDTIVAACVTLLGLGFAVALWFMDPPGALGLVVTGLINLVIVLILGSGWAMLAREWRDW